MATTSQIRQIHILKNKLNLDENFYRKMLASFDALSSTNLTECEAQILIDILNAKAATRKYDRLVRSDYMASIKQLKMIEGIWCELYYFENETKSLKGLRRFLRNKFKVDDVTFLTKHKAIKVIQALLIIRNRNSAKALGSR